MKMNEFIPCLLSLTCVVGCGASVDSPDSGRFVGGDERAQLRGAFILCRWDIQPGRACHGLQDLEPVAPLYLKYITLNENSGLGVNGWPEVIGAAQIGAPGHAGFLDLEVSTAKYNTIAYAPLSENETITISYSNPYTGGGGPTNTQADVNDFSVTPAESCYAVNRVYDPTNARLGMPCFQVAGSLNGLPVCGTTQRTLTSKCDQVPRLCGYLYCM